MAHYSFSGILDDLWTAQEKLNEAYVQPIIQAEKEAATKRVEAAARDQVKKEAAKAEAGARAQVTTEFNKLTPILMLGGGLALYLLWRKK
jgi:hypothetical protein